MQGLLFPTEPVSIIREVKGARIIYAPKGQAGEYAPLATNPYRGCGHQCAYCYVPTVLNISREEFDKGAALRPNYLAELRKEARLYQEAGITEQVMLSFSTDPYHPGDNLPTRTTLQILAEHGLAFCTLTKGGRRALRDIDLFRPDRDAFACTLTSVRDEFSLRWERAAAPASERIEVLRRFHERGIFTWVSLEPTLSAEESIRVVLETHQFVDLYKVGRVNYVGLTKQIDWRDYTLRIIEVLNKVGAKHYIKKDLQPYLPKGYHNPMRVPQHH